jgi:hypothetical protein
MEWNFKNIHIKIGIKLLLFLKYLIFQLNIISFPWYKKLLMTNNSWDIFIKNLNIIIYFSYWFNI